MPRFGRVAPTPVLHDEVRRQAAAWQDTSAYVSLHGILQASLATSLMALAGGGALPGVTPDPRALETEAADLRCAADGMATFLELLADRMRERGAASQ